MTYNDDDYEHSVTLTFVTLEGERFEVGGFTVQEACQLVNAVAYDLEDDEEQDESISEGTWAFDVSEILFVRVEKIERRG